MGTEDPRDKGERFRTLATKRVVTVTKGIRGIAKLSNRNNYSYSEAEAKKIYVHLKAELDALKAKFAAGGTSGEVDFDFD